MYGGWSPCKICLLCSDVSETSVYDKTGLRPVQNGHRLGLGLADLVLHGVEVPVYELSILSAV